MKTAKNVNAPRIFTTYDIGRMTGTDPTTVHKWIDKGLLRGYRTPGGHRRVRAEDLRSFLVAHRIPLPKELGGIEGIRVMLVDGDAGSLKTMTRALKRLRPGWEVAGVTSGVEALLSLPASAPDVVALDLGVCDADGLAICKHLSERPDTAAVKVVALCGRSRADGEKKAMAAGASHCVVKPVASRALIEAIEQASGLRPADALT